MPTQWWQWRHHAAHGVRHLPRPGSGGQTAPAAEDLTGLRVAIQGVGGVGFRLGELLKERGAVLTVSDINPEAVRRAVDELGARAVEGDAIYDADVDVFAPCALGDVLTEEHIARLRCEVVAGAANNQLPTDAQAQSLHERNILYVPDFVANMGGVLGAARLGTATDAKMRKSLQRIVQTLDRAFDQAEAEGITPHAAAVLAAKAAVQDRDVTTGGKVVARLWRNPFIARSALRVRNAIASARSR